MSLRIILQYFIGILTFLITNAQDYDYAPYVGERYDNFDWNLIKTVALSDSGNVIISPISVKMVLAMLYEASTGNTEKELQQVLSLPVSRHATRDRFFQIITSLNLNSSDHTLDIGNRIFLDKKLKPTVRFANVLKKYYDSEAMSVDFKNLRETKIQINNWAKNVTHGHVPELTSEDSLRDSIMVLANALYYKGLWRVPFDRNVTKNFDFYTGLEKSTSVPFMINFDTYFYSDIEELDVQFLRLPYKGNISMFIILPKNIDGLRNFTTLITPKIMNNLRWSLSPEDIYVHLPKFSFDYNAELTDTLKILGLTEIFENFASLPGVTVDNKNLTHVKVSSVIQKAGIEVNEEGTTAWAATDVQITNKFGKRKAFKADHPFLFYLEDEQTGNVLFVGKVVNPQISKYKSVRKT